VFCFQGKSHVKLTEIPYVEDADPDDADHYVHANHYKFHPRSKEDPNVLGSKAREETALEFPTPTDVDEVLDIMGDTSNPVQPIYREPEPDASDMESATIATSAFDIDSKQMLIFTDNPSLADKPTLVIPFINAQVDENEEETTED